MNTLSSRVLTAAHHKAIGKVTSEWPYIDYLLERLIWEVAGVNSATGRRITTHIGPELRIDILESLTDLKLSDKTLKKELKAIVKELRDLKGKRNNIVHALWLSEGPLPKTAKSRPKKKPYAAKVTARGVLKITKTTYTAKEIDNIASEISKLSDRMMNLSSKVTSNVEESDKNRQLLAKALSQHQKKPASPKPSKGLFSLGQK
jgi:hypothetical protein